MDLRRPFRHDQVLADGALARDQIGDGTFRPLFTGVSVRAEVAVSMALRAAGAALTCRGAVVAGLAAAACWDVDTAPVDTTVDLLVGAGGRRARPGLRLHRVVPAPEEVAVVDGVRVTTPTRTAVDLARWLPRADAVVVDALLAATGVGLETVRVTAAAHPEEHGIARVGPVLAWVDPRSTSPRASRLRVALLARGLAVPAVEQQLLDGDGLPVAGLALAWPAVRVGLSHTRGARAAAAAVGWEVFDVREDLAEVWGSRTRPAPVDGLAQQLHRAAGRWDPVPRTGCPRPPRLPPPPGPDGECDGGLSRLVGV